MAFIGMRHVVVAKITAHTDGSAPTYDDGMVLGKAIEANLTLNRADNPLYADDAIAENDKGLNSINIDIGVDDVTEEAQAYLGLVKKVTSGTSPNTVTTYRETGATPNDVGCGYVRVREKDGVVSYQAVWVYSVKFAFNNETSRTKGENIEWQTPTINGQARGLIVDDSGDIAFRDKRVFTDYEDAEEWIDGLADISA